MVVFSFHFYISMPLGNLWFICLQGEFPILRTRNQPDLFLLIRPPRRPLLLDIGRILIPGFIRSPPTLVIENSLPEVGVDRDFLFIEEETRRHFSHLSRECILYTTAKIIKISYLFEAFAILL